jgi:phosphate acetyltransferase
MSAKSWHDFRQKAARRPQRILLAEGEDARVVKAAVALQSEKTAIPWLVGSRSRIESLWKQQGGRDLELICVDPDALKSDDKKAWAQEWLALPKNKQRSQAEALEAIQDPLVLGCLYLKKSRVDGFVGGATRTTADTLRAAFSIIGLAPRTSTLFGFFVMENKSTGSLVVLGDCAVSPEPSPKQLANIAIGAAEAYQFFIGDEPRVAFLSFSTLGSAAHPKVDAVRDALNLARQKAPKISFEGEWQADTALDLFTAGVKGAGKSAMAGKANVLIAPDLNCGNIAYKLVQRLGQVRAVGPVLWGMAQPANDLSRGCSVEDIVDMAALTAIQAQALSAQPALAQKGSHS